MKTLLVQSVQWFKMVYLIFISAKNRKSKKYELVNIKIWKLSDFKEDIDKGSESWILTRTECINTVPNQEIIMSFIDCITQYYFVRFKIMTT